MYLLFAVSVYFRKTYDKFIFWWCVNISLVRHGETVLNYNNTFTGWIDTDLSERGIKEIEYAANLILERGYNVDVTYTSRLKRAVR